MRVYSVCAWPWLYDRRPSHYERNACGGQGNHGGGADTSTGKEQVVHSMFVETTCVMTCIDKTGVTAIASWMATPNIAAGRSAPQKMQKGRGRAWGVGVGGSTRMLLRRDRCVHSKTTACSQHFFCDFVLGVENKSSSTVKLPCLVHHYSQQARRRWRYAPAG